MVLLRILTALMSLAFGVILAVGAAAQTTSADAREAQINKVRDGLNSADPTKRLVALEEAMATKDDTLRRVALSTAFASADSDLRSLALKSAIANAPSIVVDIVAAKPRALTGMDSTNYFAAALGASIDILVQEFSRSTGTFRAATTLSAKERPSNVPAWAPVPATAPIITGPGSVSGDRVSFQVDVGSTPGRPYYGWDSEPKCSGVARLQGGSATLKGSMTCVAIVRAYGPDSETFDIAVEVLK